MSPNDDNNMIMTCKLHGHRDGCCTEREAVVFGARTTSPPPKWYLNNKSDLPIVNHCTSGRLQQPRSRRRRIPDTHLAAIAAVVIYNNNDDNN